MIADITGIFILLFHFYHSLNLAGNIMMIASANGCNMIGINATYEKHQEICLHLLSTRGVTCCYFCVGKSSALRKTHSEHLGVTAIQMGDVVIEVRRFILDCYSIGLRNVKP